MAWDELEHRRQQARRTKELLTEADRARAMIKKSGDLAGAAELLVEIVIELAAILKEELERPDRR